MNSKSGDSRINNYTNDLLLDFLDAFHERLREELQRTYGERWIDEGLRRPFKANYFDRVEQMLQSPMRVVDMGREPEELYGVEHLPNIIEGNWEHLKSVFGDHQKDRTKVYLGDIAELRNNLAHRRKGHLVGKDELMHFAHNAWMLLRAIDSPHAESFAEIVDALMQGEMPWGARIIQNNLPSRHEMYEEFVGRSDQLQQLKDWFANDAQQAIMAWGYGGAGKSALAYQFAKEVLDSSPTGLDAVIWLTAKRIEYYGGASRERSPDFSDTRGFCQCVWQALYDESPDDKMPSDLIDELSSTTCLLIVDDLDSVLSDHETAEFLLHDLRRCKSKVLYTSRQQVPGTRYIEVQGFEGEDLEKFIHKCAEEHGINGEQCLRRKNAIHSVTDGIPLFVDDLIRYSVMVGTDGAINEWSQRRGDAAREYALRRQLEHLREESASDVLMAIAVATSARPLSVIEISEVIGRKDDDAEAGLKGLLRWRLVHQVAMSDEGVPLYSMNANTQRLTMTTFKESRRWTQFQEALRSLAGERLPESKRREIESCRRRADEIQRRESIQAAATFLENNMIGDLSESPDMYAALGRAFAQDPNQYASQALQAFGHAHKCGARRVDTYLDWIRLWQRMAEDAVGKVPDAELLQMWRNAANVAELGVSRCGKVDILCQTAAYLSTREALTCRHMKQFTWAQGAYSKAIDWAEEALEAPTAGKSPVPRSRTYKTLALAYEGLGSVEELAQVLRRWHAVASGQPDFGHEIERLRWRVPQLKSYLPWMP